MQLLSSVYDVKVNSRVMKHHGYMTFPSSCQILEELNILKSSLKIHIFQFTLFSLCLSYYFQSDCYLELTTDIRSSPMEVHNYYYYVAECIKFQMSRQIYDTQAPVLTVVFQVMESFVTLKLKCVLTNICFIFPKSSAIEICLAY